MLLDEVIDRQRCLVSIDADFFTMPAEQRLAEPLAAWFADQVRRATPVIICDDHVDLVDAMVEPVDVVVNFDFHLDIRLDFLAGAPAHVPPRDATVFESILSTGRATSYVWAHPGCRRNDAARAYAAAWLAGRQPRLRQIHCLPGSEVLDRLPRSRTTSIFVCRSPAYATPQTDAIFDRLRSLAKTETRHSP